MRRCDTRSPVSDVQGSDGIVCVSPLERAWMMTPASSRSFPVSNYQAVLSPEGRTCLVTVPTSSCTIAALSNGATYSARVRALNGVG